MFEIEEVLDLDCFEEHDKESEQAILSSLTDKVESGEEVFFDGHLFSRFND